MLCALIRYAIKKGFTLIELVVVIAIMALLVGFTVPNVDKAIARRERRSAENDCSEVYRLAISAVSDLWTSTSVANNRPDFTLADGVYDVDYATQLVKSLYDTSIIMDLGLAYYSPTAAKANHPVESVEPENDAVAACVPTGYASDTRVKIFNGGNVKPYIVVGVQIKKINGTKVAILTVSYHNTSARCKSTAADQDVFDSNSAYKNNDGDAIVYNFIIYNR
jgi:prepilin-type N-terminal cleavage/methylation domain